MPCLFFVFSRKGCENLAHLVEGSLIDSSDSAAIRHIWDHHLHRYKDILEHLPQAHQLKDLCMRGIAFHHSGLLPILREIVELLFGRGLLKCLFATETFAVGINMPTKTVVFLDLEKYSDENEGLRLLRTDEYIQMAGRAGRRGKDEKGYVFYLPQRDPVSLGELQLMMTGKKAPITSQMDFGYDFILKTFQSKNLKWMDLMTQSYWYRQAQGEKVETQKELEVLQKKIKDLGCTEEQLKQCKAREEAEAKVKTAVNAAKKEAQRALESMKNKQVGPAWDTIWKTYQTHCLLLKDMKTKESTLNYLNSIHMTKVEPSLHLLRKWGFLNEDNTLTDLGILGSEINEGQPIMMAKAFQEGVWKGMTQEEFVEFLAAFLQEGKEEEPSPGDLDLSPKLRDALNYVDMVAFQCQKDQDTEQVYHGKKGFWDLRTAMIEPVRRWLEEEDIAVICQEYGLYEGNFLRSILKVANMVEEWTSLATFTKSIELLQLLEGLKEKLVRDIAKPESLYLTLQ
jgi:superfamily II RNA helicase